MKEVKIKQFDDTKNDEFDSVEDRIPSLTSEDLLWSENHENKAWAHDMLAQLTLGQTSRITNAGVGLQKTSDSSLRCISILDHPTCFRLLGMMRVTFDSCGILLEVDPSAVIMPHVPNEEKMEAGVDKLAMEVV